MAFPLLNLIPGALKQLWSLGTDLVQYKREIVQAKHDVKLEAIKSSSDWELAKITEVGGSWKDEFWTIVLAIPAILVMLAPVVELILFPGEYHKGDFIKAVIGGMQALDTAPEWYTASLLTAISASFGIKGYNHYKSNGRKDQAVDALKQFGVKVVQKDPTVVVQSDSPDLESAPPAGSTATSGAWPDLKKPS